MQKILVIQQKLVGDVLASSIICQLLKSKYPNPEVHYLVNANTVAVIKNHPAIDHVVVFKPSDSDSLTSLYRFLKRIKQAQYDIVIDAYCKIQSHLISLFSRAPDRVAYDKWYTRFIYTNNVRRQKTALTQAATAIENRVRLVVSEQQLIEHIIEPCIYLTDSEKSEAQQIIIEKNLNNKPLVMLSALGSSSIKTYPLKYMVQIIEHIFEHNDINMLFNYMPHQAEISQQLYAAIKPEFQPRIFSDIYGRSLRSFLSLLSCCDVLIGNEGGAVNMAKALKIPTFTLFSSSIDKGGWNIFEDGKTHVSVHLADYFPEIYRGIESRRLKKQTNKLYLKFQPNLFFNELNQFCSQHLKKQLH